jgi:hypothetical protein
MSLRKFMNKTATIKRIDDTDISGTKQPKGSYVTVTGMDALECALQPINASPVVMQGGLAFSELFRILFNNEQLLAISTTAEIRSGDQAHIGGVVYEIVEASRRESLEDRFFACLAQRKAGV